VPRRSETPIGARARRFVVTQGSRLTLTWITRIGVVGLLAASALFGGLDDAEPPAIPDLEVAERHDGAPLAITVERAVVVDEIAGVAKPVDDGGRLLLVVATAENTSAAPVLAPVDSLRVGGLDSVSSEDPARSINVLDDDSTVHRLQPRVPTRLVFIWDVSAAELADGDELRVGLFDLTFVETRDIVINAAWQDPALAAVVTVPVEDLDLAAGTQDGGTG
jgi:hypothetical protein